MSAGREGPATPAGATEREHAAIERELEYLHGPYRVVGDDPAAVIHGPFGPAPVRFNSRAYADVLVRELNRAWHGGRLVRGECGHSGSDYLEAEIGAAAGPMYATDVHAASKLVREFFFGSSVLRRVQLERGEQDAKWGQQNHALPHWMLILMEEVGEVNKAVLEREVLLRDGPTGPDPTAELDARNGDVCTELIQVAAMAVAIVECLERLRARLNP